MTPLELLGLVCLLGIARIALSLRPVRAGAPGGVAPGASLGDSSSDAARAAAAPSALAAVREYLDAFIVAGLVALLLITFVVRTFYIPSGSMEPTLQIDDVLLVNEFAYRVGTPHDQDIAVFTPPVASDNDFIKRVIGSPGDRIRVHGGVVYRNGVALAEPYIAQKPDYELEIKNYGVYVDGVALDASQANVPPRARWQAPDRIPPGCYFMMGDNRNLSEDSHIWGFAQAAGPFYSGSEKGKKAAFTGRAFLLFWPLNRIRILR